MVSIFTFIGLQNSDNDPQRVQDDSTRDLFDRSCTSWFGDFTSSHDFVGQIDDQFFRQF